MTKIQAVIFRKKYYNIKDARYWLKINNLKPIKPPHQTVNFYRFRIMDPDQFKSFITKKFKTFDLIIGRE